MAIEGVDYSVARPSPTELYKAGKRFACRYLYGTAPGKAVTRAEIDALHKAGLAVVLNWEWQADEAKGGFATGRDRGRRARDIVSALGAPPNAAVYFSVDYDARDMAPVREYFRGITSVWPKGRTGIYGGRRVIEAAKREGWCPWLWQTFAWSDGVWVPGAHIQQYRNEVNFQGHDVDLDRALTATYGQWAIAPPPPPQPPYRRPIATLATVKGETVMPSYLIKHANHPEVFGLWPSGLVRHIGPAEYKAYTVDAAPAVPLLITDDAAEYERLLMYTRALQD
jgi:Rv2525c-like, glycoside hydrolase-like domain